MKPLCRCIDPACRLDHSEPADTRPGFGIIEYWQSHSELFAPPANDMFEVE